MFARVFLLLALVAMMMVAGVAANKNGDKSFDKGVKGGDKSGVKGGKGAKAAKYECAKTYAGCKTCTGSLATDDLVCTACADKNAITDGGACVCDFNNGYGTVTKQQVWDWWKAQKDAGKNKGGKNKHFNKYAKCVLCADYGLVSVDGVCELVQ